MINQTVLRSAIICALLTTVVACGGSNSDSASTVSSSSTSTSSTSSTSNSSNGTAAVALASSTYVVATSSTAAVVTVNRVGGAVGVVNASYATVNGTATAGADFSYTSGTVTWANGDTSAKTISVPVTAAAAGKSFSVELTSVTGAAAFGSPSSATVAMSGTSTAAASSSSSSSSGGSSQSVAASASSTCTSSSPTSSTTCLLAFVNGLSGQSRHILLGQHTNFWDSNPMDIVTPIPGLTGSQVAMIGVSNFFLGANGVSDSLGVSPAAYAAIANSWLAGGGIVVVTQEASNPYSSGEALADVYTAGTNANNKWNTYLDAQVAWFNQIHGAVIWRPFAEANYGHSFGNLTPAEMVLLWQYTHEYFASHGVTNVVWMLNLNAWDQRNHGSTYYDGSDYYPGSSYVDIVSMDSYPPYGVVGATSPAPWVKDMYNFFLTTGKPIFFGEVGSNSNDNAIVVDTVNNDTIVQEVVTGYPKVVGILFWCLNQAIAKQNGASAVMSNPAVITLSDVPAAFLSVSSKSSP